MGNAKKPDELKKRALLAKQRLKMGYWQKLESERRSMEEEGVLLGREIAELQREKLKRDAMRATDVRRAEKEERLYEKVCEILDADEDTQSPIGQLIDKEEFMRLDDGGRQKYILELSEKFRELSKRYYLEHHARA